MVAIFVLLGIHHLISGYRGGESSWERKIGRFLYGVSDSEIDSLGGEGQVTLNSNQIPSHAHSNPNNHFYVCWGSGAAQAQGLIVSTSTWGKARAYDKTAWLNKPGFGAEFENQMLADQATINSNLTGGNQPHNNIPPYIGCVIWKRVS